MTTGPNSPATNIIARTINLGLAGSPSARSAEDELRAARGKLRDAMAAFENELEFDRNPLLFQRHWYGDSIDLVRNLINDHWPSRALEVDQALANRESSQYGWMRAALGRLDALASSILERSGPSPKTIGDVNRAFLMLRDEGRTLRARINAIPWGERQRNLGFAQDELDSWLVRCRQAVWTDRPDAIPAFEGSVGSYIPIGSWPVDSVDTAAIDLWRERSTRIDLVLRVLDGLIATRSPSSLAPPP